jgi:ABC-type transport system involved in multi-copper enzyme maturation permease subunit
MRALLWKDYRLNRGIVLMGVTLLLAPYATVAAVELHAHWPSLPSRADWSGQLLSGSLISLILSQLTLVTLAGNAIAAERLDRSAEFLAYLPPSRRRILSSKLYLAILVTAVIWGVNVAIAEVVAPRQSHAPAESPFNLMPWSMLAAATVMLFGAAWLGSAVLTSPAIATSLGIGATVAVPLLPLTTATLFGWPTLRGSDDIQHWSTIACLVFGIGSFLCGTALYLRRVEP